jgi:general L-amino acid transport system ATP-binding protein
MTVRNDQVFADATQSVGEPIIELEGVDKFFGSFQALKDINLKIGRQEVVVVIGPSGSGKSTMIRCINRLEEHDNGRIVVDGIELSEDVRNIQEIRRETGMVFQQFNLFPHLSVIDNVTLAPRQVRRVPKDEAEKLAMELLERVRIPEQARKYPGQLSGLTDLMPELTDVPPWPTKGRQRTNDELGAIVSKQLPDDFFDAPGDI